MKLRALVVVAAVCASAVFLRAQGTGPVEVLQIRPNFYMIGGAGANIAAQVGANGVVLVNAGTAAASDAVLAAVAKVSNQPIRYIINTSSDPDVVGGSAILAKAGKNITTPAIGALGRVSVLGSDLDSARVFAHENVLNRMRAAGPGGAESAPSELWPSETFAERRRTMYFNDEGIEIIHLPAAHTDGDTVVFFRKSDVVVVGNIIDTERFPVIDLARGGSVKGEIDALNRIIEMAIPPGPFIGLPNGPNASANLQGGTDVLPGHGRIYRQLDVVDYRDMVVIVSDIVQDLVKKNMTLDQIKAARPARAFETLYGATSGPWTTNDFIEAVYKSLTAAKS